MLDTSRRPTQKNNMQHEIPKPDWDYDTHDNWQCISMAEINRACDKFLQSRGEYVGVEAQQRFARRPFNNTKTE